MGEIAEMMLSGVLCEGCGEYLGEETGFPGYCSPQCAEGRGATIATRRPAPSEHSYITNENGNRWVPYMPESQQFKDGILGRWQFFNVRNGCWQNCRVARLPDGRETRHIPPDGWTPEASQ